MYMKRKILFRSTNIHFSKKKEKKMKRKLILTFLLQINSLIVRTRSFKLMTKKKESKRNKTSWYSDENIANRRSVASIGVSMRRVKELDIESSGSLIVIVLHDCRSGSRRSRETKSRSKEHTARGDAVLCTATELISSTRSANRPPRHVRREIERESG